MVNESNYTAKTPPRSFEKLNFGKSSFRQSMNEYTEPRLYKGKEPKKRTKQALQEQAAQEWYVDFKFNGQRIRKSNGLNRIRDYDAKFKAFEALRNSYSKLLASGYNPVDDEENAQLRKDMIGLSATEAVAEFLKSHREKGSKTKTIQSYESKLNYFAGHFGKTKVDKINDNDVTRFLIKVAKDNKWSNKTYNNARLIYAGLFNFLKQERYINDNPLAFVKTKSVAKTKKHAIFSDKDIQIIMEYLKEHDPYLHFFCISLYNTCLRPNELRHVVLNDIDLDKRVLTVRADIAKNKKDALLPIPPAYYQELARLNIDRYPKEYYLTGDTTNIIGKHPTSNNVQYKRLIKHLRHLKLDNKNYTLYSFKSYSNVKRVESGWSLADIMKVNRHSSIGMTEIYLKDLTKTTDIQNKDLPAI